MYLNNNFDQSVFYENKKKTDNNKILCFISVYDCILKHIALILSNKCVSKIKL